ncbi:hypothetical protein GTP58_21760 [Duganella sp. CY15W]|uniref:hypothetical protein n=1 Tax=Duganella sp. CY15W TaxID=2692172 RepID=UPI00136A481F|nr:hypothetical protein [Duganella sp. CY15W]MYM30968.1 hypothetical protein [Duganella sp. CY15W]
MKPHSKTVIFWGAGATAALGIRTTVQQTQFIQRLAGADALDGKIPPLNDRIERALGRSDDPLHGALGELITILGDRPENYEYIGAINHDEMAAMGKSWKGTKEDVKGRIMHLRLFYDWPALKSLIGICPGSSGDSFKLNDLFNLLDMHGPAGFGVRAGTRHARTEQFFDARRLAGAANALKMLLGTLFYIDYQYCLREKSDVLAQYLGFAKLLGQRILKQGHQLAEHNIKLDTPKFYEGDVAFVSLNYDPIALWTQYLANRELNNDKKFSVKNVPLTSFHDAGHVIPSRRINGQAVWPWYPMNEAAAQRLNEAEPGASRVRLTKFLFPHGCLCWRECPDCGKLSSYYGDEWKIESDSLFLPPPLSAFEKKSCPNRIEGTESEQRQAGEIDARACLHCGTLSYAHNTQMVMQSSFKSSPPSFIEEIQRDLRAVAMKAEHIIFMGYSLPLDDVSYRAFFAARCQRFKTQSLRVCCTIVGWDGEHQSWFGPKDLKSGEAWFKENGTIKAAIDIFGEDNVRFFGGGAPGVFLEDGVVSEKALERLLTWSED